MLDCKGSNFMILLSHMPGNHTIAVIKGHESYGLLKESCRDVFDSVNKLIRDGKICVNGKDIPVEIYLGGDYKVQ